MVVQTDFTGDFSIELNEIENSLYQTLHQNPKPPLYRMDTTGIVPDTIFFDSIYFKGGRDYLVTLQLTNDCGNYLFEDTISIPFGVDIRMKSQHFMQILFMVHDKFNYMAILVRLIVLGGYLILGWTGAILLLW
jgi:hypothetical protein